MPQPPNIDPSGKLNFVTNYLLMGCTPPSFLFLNTATPPIHALTLLFLLPDFTDIGQAILDPRGGRRRKPGRHGRKKRRKGGFPDPSDLIGQKGRGVLNPHNALKFGPVSFAFRIWNAYELAAFTAAIAEGVTDIGYEGLLGVFEVDPNHCQEFGRLVKEDDVPQLAGGAGPPIWPIDIDNVIVNHGFNEWDTGCTNQFSDFVVYCRMVVHNGASANTCRAQVGLEKVGTDERFLSREVTLNPGESEILEVSGDFERFDQCGWGIGNRADNPLVLSREIVAFSKADIPWPF